jgi:hypothetical protein
VDTIIVPPVRQLSQEPPSTPGGRRRRDTIYIPFQELQFLEKSVTFAGDKWRKRFMAAKSHATLHMLPLEREIWLSSDPYEQTQLWMLETAERYGADRVDFICLWNGQAGDGPGGTRHLMQEVQFKGGRTHWLDTRVLWH